MYYLLSSFGVLLGLIIAVLRVKIKWFSLPVFLYLALNILSFFVVSKLFGLLSYGIHLINRGALSFARLWNETGYIIWGAIIGFSLSAILLAKKFKIKKKDAYLISALIITSFHWMAKLGCFHAGCCYGIISDSMIAMLPVTSIGPVVERIPVQLIESIIVFIIWCIIILFSFSQRLHKHTLSFYLFIYAITRFVLEFFRGDYTRGKIGCFYFSQWISISVLLVIIVIYIFMFIKKINQRSKKKMKKNSVKFLAVFLMLFTSCLMTSCSDSQNDSITQAQTIEDEFEGIEVTPGYQFIKSFDVVTDKNDTIVVKLVKSIERNTYSLLTETGTGKLVASALCKFIDGTEVLIEDVQDFALDTEIASIEINLLDVKPVEDISLPAKKYIGYYLGTNYTFDFTANTYPLDAQTYVEYYSSNTSVARINRHGKLKIVGAGTTTISAISLNGGCVAHCLFKIKNGADKLKDSMGFAEFSNVALDGNRYDEVSMQTTIFEHMAISSKTGTVLVGGKASVSGYSGPFSGIVNYGIPTDGKGFNSKIQIDPENKYRSDYVVDVAYVPNNDSFLVLGKIASDSYNVSSATTFIVCLKETYDSDIGFVLESTYTKEFNMDIQKIAICDNSIYVVNYEGTVQKLNSATFEVENQFETNIKEISILKANNSSNSLLLVGKNENGANCIAVIDLGNFSITKGYSSVFTDGTITDAEFVSEDASKIVVISNGTINSNNVGLVEAFRLTNNKASFESYKHQIIESSEYTITKLNKILYNNGLIVILGYAVGEQAVKSSCCGEDMVRYGYGTVLKMSQHLEFVGNSYKYFNGGDGGKDQQFLNGLVLPNGSLIAIGDSNYKYEDVRNGYIQYNIQIID